MATKRKLSDLVRQESQSPNPVLQTPELPESMSAPVPITSELTESVAFDQQTHELEPDDTIPSTSQPSQVSEKLTESVTSQVPKYMTLDRKEARLRPDQVEGLTRLTKSLNRQRKGQGERITDNTLIRVAVDLLLSKAEVLQGTTEEELRSTLKL